MRVRGRFHHIHIPIVIMCITPCSYTRSRDIWVQCVYFNESLFSDVLRAFQAPSEAVTTAPSG